MSTKAEDNTIVFCPPFFDTGLLHLDNVIKNLKANPGYKTRPNWMKSKG
jgi:hypothetical protein